MNRNFETDLHAMRVLSLANGVADGEQKPAGEWLLPTERARKLVGAKVTADRREIGAAVVAKDLHFGMGLRATHLRKAERRDGLLLLVAIAHTLLTLLGAAI